MVPGYPDRMIRHFTLGLFLAFFLSALGFVYAFRHVSDLMTQEVMALSDEDFRLQHRFVQRDATETVTLRSLTEKLLGRSTQWKQYTNPYLGFDFSYPDMAVLTAPDCDAVYAPVQVFTDNESSRAFVALAHRFGDNCATQTVTLRDLQMNRVISSADVPWVIEVIPAADEAALTAYIRNRFGPGCSLGAHTETKHKGTFDVEIQSDGLPLGESLCPVNYLVAIKYSPTLQKAAVWILGQEPAFMEDTSGGSSFDQQMAESFRWGSEGINHSSA
jgi:hypothetical protein